MSDENERRADYPMILRLVTRIDERTENTEKSVEKLLHAMFEGNGRPSVLARLATIETDVRWERRTIAMFIGIALGLLGGNIRL